MLCAVMKKRRQQNYHNAPFAWFIKRNYLERSVKMTKRDHRKP